MRQLASVQKIKAITPIEGADAIERIEVLGWELVAKKGEFKVGDLCVYVEIDGILPERPEFEFMRARKFRVKTIKLRGQISQGIAFPLSILPADVVPVEDIDVTEILGIKKWDPEQESIIVEKEPEFNDKNEFVRAYKKYKYLTVRFLKKLFGIPTGTASDDFPSYVPKTDETRVQTSQRGLETHKGKRAYITEKLEGSSTTYITIKSKGNFFKRLFSKQPMKFIVCSRNRIVNNRADDRWVIADKYSIARKMGALGRNFAIQGELIGPKIQGNLYELPERDFRMYLAYDIDEKRYFTLQELKDLANELQIIGVPLLDENHIVHTDTKAYVDLSIGNSRLNPKKKREGIVIRLAEENYSFKSINPEYLLGQKDE
jgi:hypothetical protein